MTEKRYQVFVSSTYEDLREERAAVMQALLSLDCIPTGMELFPAADEDSWTHIERFISGCDYYILIIGGRYGSSGPSGLSFTEMEYDLAEKAGIPVLSFIHRNPGDIPASKTETTDRGRAALAGFRSKVESRRHARYWTSPDQLAGLVALSMNSAIKINPRIGWVRADLVPAESDVRELLRLRQRIDELEKQASALTRAAGLALDSLASGEDTFLLHFSHESPNGPFSHNEMLVSWNELLGAFGPVLLNWASEGDLRDQINGLIKNLVMDRKGKKIFSVYVRDADLQKIKLQFRALGVIETDGEKGMWRLTTYGDNLMTQVAAIKTPERNLLT